MHDIFNAHGDHFHATIKYEHYGLEDRDTWCVEKWEFITELLEQYAKVQHVTIRRVEKTSVCQRLEIFTPTDDEIDE